MQLEKELHIKKISSSYTKYTSTSHGVLCPAIVTPPEKKTRKAFGKSAEGSDKECTGTQSLALRAETVHLGLTTLDETPTRDDLIETCR